MKNVKTIFIIVLLLCLTAYSAYKVFNLRHSEVIIDYVAFFGGLFLAIEAMYTLIRSKTAIWPYQIPRLLRLAIGTCVFSIHTLQFMR